MRPAPGSIAAEQPLARVALWLAMLLLPQAAVLLPWFVERISLESGLLIGATRLLRELAADSHGIRRAIWWTGTCGAAGIVGSFWLQRRPSSGAARWFRAGCPTALGLIAIAAAHATGSRAAWIGAIAGMPVLGALLFVDGRMEPSFPAGASASARSRTTLLIQLAAGCAALAFHLPQVVDFGSPGYDETFSLLHYAALGPIPSIGRYDFPNNHIGFNVLAGVLFPGGTPSLLVTRLLSFGWFLGLLLAAAGVAYRLAGRTAQIGAISCLLLHADLVPRASAGRGYTMAMCLATLGWYLLLDRDPEVRRRYAPLCFLGASAVLPSWFALLGAAAIADWRESRTWSGLRPWLASMAVAWLWYLPACAFLALFWDETWLGQRRMLLSSSSNLPSILISYLTGSDAPKADGWLWAASAIGILSVAGAGLALRRCRWFTALNLGGLGLMLAVSLAYPVSAVMRQLGMFIPLWAVLTGVGLARFTRPLGPRMRALAVVGAAGVLIALPVLTGAVRLQRGRPFQSAMLTAAALRDRMGPTDLLHAGAPDSSVIVFFMGAEQYHHALDVILVRNAWQQSDGDIWMVVRARRSLERELGRLRGYRADGRFSPPERVFHGGTFTVYRLQRRR